VVAKAFVEGADEGLTGTAERIGKSRRSLTGFGVVC